MINACDVDLARRTDHCSLLLQTSSMLMNFFASVLVYQDVQKKIHQELDAVVGRNRTPVLSDLSSLTYLRSVWMESMRLNPTIPTGIHLPHMFDTNLLAGISRRPACIH